MSEILICNLGPHLLTFLPHAHMSLDNHRSRQICFGSNTRQLKWTLPFLCFLSQKRWMLTTPWEWKPGQIINPFLDIKQDIKEFQYDCHFLYQQRAINETYVPIICPPFRVMDYLNGKGYCSWAPENYRYLFMNVNIKWWVQNCHSRGKNYLAIHSSFILCSKKIIIISNVFCLLSFSTYFFLRK